MDNDQSILFLKVETVGMLHVIGTHSHSTSDIMRTITEKTESVYIQKFQRKINGTLSSSEFSKSLANEREAVGSYFASGFIE